MVRCKSSFVAGAFVLGVLLVPNLPAQQQAGPKAEVRPFTFTTVDILDSDSQLQRLLKQRYNAAGEDLEARMALYRLGRVELEAVCASLERFTKAGLELAATPVERVHDLEESLAAAKSIEAIVEEKFKHEVEPVQAFKHARYVRLDLEIQLLRAREAAKLGAAGSPPAEVARR